VVVHIVEDDDAVADALALALEGLDRLPQTYSDGETFLSRAELASDDWVIIDLGLPGMSGTEVVRLLNRLPSPPKILAISGKPQVTLMQHMKEIPELKVLRKPLSIESLSAAMI